MRLSSIAFAAIVLGAAVSACAPNVDLQAVQQYSKATADASTSFSSVASDYYQTCLRRRELQLKPREMAQTLIQMNPAYTATKPLALTTPAPATPCLAELNVSQEWDRRNGIVLGYVRALGYLAGVDVQPTFAPLGNALVSASIITQAQDDAFTQLAQQISSTAIRGAQRDAIANAVKTVNPSLIPAVAALKKVDDAYGQTLNAEFNETSAYYYTLIRSELPQRAGATPPPAVVDTIAAQRKRYADALNAINDKRTSTLAYAAVLDDILSTHQQLYDAVQSKPSLQSYIGIVRQDALPLYQDVESLAKVVK